MMTTSQPSYPLPRKRLYVRWYEKSLTLTRLLQWLKHQNPLVQDVFGHAMGRLAKDCHDPYARTEQLKNHGADIGLGLLHSQKRRRWYDRIPSLHLGMRRLYVLSPLECTHIAERLLETKGLIETYQRIQQEWGLTCEQHLVEQLMNQCLSHGVEAAHDTLVKFERRLFLTCGR
jgi:hypothetical protein